MKRYLMADEKRFIIRKYMAMGLSYAEAKQKLQDDKLAIAVVTKKERQLQHSKTDSLDPDDKNKKLIEGLKIQ